MKQIRKKAAGIASLLLALVMIVTMMPVQTKAATTTTDDKLTYTIETKTQEYKDDDGYLVKTISYQYPVFTGDSDAVTALNAYYTAKLAAFLKNAETDLADASSAMADRRAAGDDTSVHYKDDVICKVTTNNDKYICIVQNGCYYSLGAHGSPYRSSVIFNVQTGKQVKATALLGVTKKKLNTTVRTAFLKKYNNTKGTENFLFYDGLKLLKKTLNSTNFNVERTGSHGYYLKNNCLYFYYEPCMVGPYATGYVQINIGIN